MAGQFTLRGIDRICLDRTPNGSGGGEVIPAPADPTLDGFAILSWDPTGNNLTVAYQGQQGTINVSLPRVETKVLAQNVFGGVPVNIQASTILGSIYLPTGELSANSLAYLTVADGQTPASMTITLQTTGGVAINVANFQITMSTTGSLTQSRPIQVLSSAITAGWYNVVSSLSTQTAAGLVNGISLIVDPPT